MQSNVQKLRAVPLIVILDATPRIWTLRPLGERFTELAGARPETLTFVSHQPKTKQKRGVMGLPFPAPAPRPARLDGLEVREQFMKLKTDQDFVQFLKHTGVFSQLREFEEKTGWTRQDLIDCQQVLRELALHSPDQWNKHIEGLIAAKVSLGCSRRGQSLLSQIANARHATVEFLWEGSAVALWKGAKSLAMIRTSDVVSCIVATIQIDHLRGAKFGACSRTDCKMFYEITSKHKRRYCTPYCANLVNLRHRRRRDQNKTKQAVRQRRREKAAFRLRHKGTSKTAE